MHNKKRTFFFPFATCVWPQRQKKERNKKKIGVTGWKQIGLVRVVDTGQRNFQQRRFVCFGTTFLSLYELYHLKNIIPFFNRIQ